MLTQLKKFSNFCVTLWVLNINVVGFMLRHQSV